MAPPLEKPQKGEAYLADKAVLLVLERVVIKRVARARGEVREI
jgi:hypothetical protein